jgi:hypothetical protein
MKYKIGDRVKIKDLEYNSIARKAMDDDLPDMIGVIEDIMEDRFGGGAKIYHLEGFEFSILETEIDYVIEEIPIESRFEILDL